MADIPKLEDMPLEDRRKLRSNDPIISDYARRASLREGVPADTLNLIRSAENSQSIGPGSIGPANHTGQRAQGIYQFLPTTFADHGGKDVTDPLDATDTAARMALKSMKILGTDDKYMIGAAHNAGPYNKELKQGLFPTNAETVKYVKNMRDTDAINNGFIPDSELSPEQLARQKAYKAPSAAPVAIVAHQSDTIPDSELSPEQLARKSAWEHSSANPNYYPPTGGMVENALAGAGKAFSDVGKGAGQLTVGGVNSLAHMFGKKDLIDKNAVSTNESNGLDAALMNTGAGQVGNFAGDAAMTALPFGALTKLGMVKKAAALAGAVPGVGGALSAALPTTIAGSALGAVQPVQDEEGLGARALNAGFGAAAGPLSLMMGAGASRLGKTKIAQAIADKAGNAPEFIRNLGSAIVDKFAPSKVAESSPAKVEAIQAAFDNGVHVYPGQIGSTSKVALSPEQHNAQSKAFSKAVIANDLGQSTSNLKTGLENANKQASADYNSIYKGKNIDISDTVPALKALHNPDRDPRFDVTRRSDYAKQIINDAIASVEKNPTIAGEDMQKKLGNYKGLVRKLQAAGSGPNNMVDQHAVDTIHGVMDTLTNSTNKVLSEPEKALLKDTNARYRNMMRLEPVLGTDLHGKVSPTAYYKAVSKSNPLSFSLGRGDQTGNRLAQYGSTYMTEAPEEIRKGNPLLTAMANHSGLAALGGLGAGHLFDNSDTTGGQHIGAMGAGALGAKVLASMGNRSTPTTNRLLAHELAERGGALSKYFRPGNLATTATLEGNEQNAANNGQQQINTNR